MRMISQDERRSAAGHELRGLTLTAHQMRTAFETEDITPYAEAYGITVRDHALVDDIQRIADYVFA